MSAWLEVTLWKALQKKLEVNCGQQMKVKYSPTETRTNRANLQRAGRKTEGGSFQYGS